MVAFLAPESNLVKVALVNQGTPVLFDADVLDRPGTLDTIYAAKILRKETHFYWCELGLSRPGLLTHEKGLPPLQEGEKALVQISREAFADSGESLIHGQQKPVEVTRQIVLGHQACLYFPLQKLFKLRSASPILPLSHQQQYLQTLFEKIEQQFITSSAPAVLSAGPSVIERFLKELPEATPIHVATPELMLLVKLFCRNFRPDLLEKLVLRQGNLFAEEGLDEIWQICLDSVVSFASGRIVMESTACVTSIDVNTTLGNAAEANWQAVKIIAEQLIWRRLSGNVIIDFAPDSEVNRKKMVSALKQRLLTDRPSWRILGWSPLGWLELQRAKRRIPLETIMKLYRK
ncbi:ribonuclease E/G [Candidatus Paracaedibacter symbiosus]|uniref:ribonuclease E/G n=1 Tax=Candidatus Paracaedibacter symbiosus TaxID=244582 RepID=UPI000509814B|nr:ribonuclease E/G [Candidatus Paracaedibacter symbiosus]